MQVIQAMERTALGTGRLGSGHQYHRAPQIRKKDIHIGLGVGVGRRNRGHQGLALGYLRVHLGIVLRADRAERQAAALAEQLEIVGADTPHLPTVVQLSQGAERVMDSHRDFRMGVQPTVLGGVSVTRC